MKKNRKMSKKSWEGVEPRAKAVSKRAVTASDKEQSENPRSRSAKLRAVEKER